jgi:formate hydrogenlyase subunit 3/multisubunit Na+/H+ antiporter MnhD subunit
MSYVGFTPFIGFAAAEAILHLGLKASVKRKVFPWCVILSALSFLVVMPLTGLRAGLLIFVIPVLAGVVFILIKFTKVCERCGAGVRTNQPFADEEHCPSCGSSLK